MDFVVDKLSIDIGLFQWNKLKLQNTLQLFSYLYFPFLKVQQRLYKTTHFIIING